MGDAPPGYPIRGQFNRFSRNYQALEFRKPSNIVGPRRPVNGGRWNVRKYDVFPGKRVSARPMPWRAWTMGKASIFNRNFHTQVEAVAWARKVAMVYAVKELWQRERLIEELRADFKRERARRLEERKYIENYFNGKLGFE